MNPGGDAAEQVVRLSLEGVEVAAKISGNGAKNIALLLYATLKQEQKTKGKARLTSMLKSGKEKVYPIIAKAEYEAADKYKNIIADFPEVETVMNDETHHGDAVLMLLK